jgi:hypothetical protein
MLEFLPKIAPVFSLRPWQRHRNPIRVPDKHAVAGLVLQQPLLVNVFDQTLAANISGEDHATIQHRFWLVALMASVSQGNLLGSNQPFGLQLFHTKVNAQGEQGGARHQLFPIDAGNFCGTAQKPAYLRKAKYFDDGTEIIARVQNLQPNANAIQIVLFGYIPGTGISG